MSGKPLNWHKSNGKPTQLPGVRFPNDRLGRAAKAAFVEWVGTLNRQQRKGMRTSLAKRR
jgi:hypothetical protein